MADNFNASCVDLDNADKTGIICYLNKSDNEYDGRLGARISALFVILVCSTLATMVPVATARNQQAHAAGRTTRLKWLRMPLWFYLFARYFGAGVIIATAFIHLLDPAYEAIGPASCVGMTGGWAGYSWPPAIAMTSGLMLFLLEFLSMLFVEAKFGVVDDHHAHGQVENLVTGNGQATNGPLLPDHASVPNGNGTPTAKNETDSLSNSASSLQTTREFGEQIAAFMILEFGVVFHSIIIGLNLAVAGDEFTQLYPVLVFHQTFEGLGIGARLSSIPFPQHLRWAPWALCLAYGFTTPIAIAVGLGLSTTYDPGSFTASVISGVFDSTSAGILLYTGFVELLARDFLFNPERTKDPKRLALMLVCLYAGVATMALLGKWA